MTGPRKSALLAAVALAAAAAGCDHPPANALTSCSGTYALPAAVKTDILFVVDDSGSMSEEQANVAANLSTFVGALDASPVALDYQIGVTNTSIVNFDKTTTTYGATCNGTAAPNAGLQYPDGRLVAVNAAGQYDYASPLRIYRTGAPLSDFQANVKVGTCGSGKEQPFFAARHALERSAPGGANEGFLRPGSRLAVVFVSDEDDCSDPNGVISTDGVVGNDQCHVPSTDPSHPNKSDLLAISDLVSFLKGPIAGEQHEVVAAAIVGLDLTSAHAPSCGDSANPYCDQPIVPGVTCATAFDRGDRFASLLDTLGAATTVRDSICDASFAGSLQAIARMIIPESMPLEGAPADWRMLSVTVTKASGAVVGCRVALDGPSVPPTADAIYTPPLSGRQAKITFQNACLLAPGDRVQLQIVCAG